jgi:prevent-host-death family protein
MTTPDDQISISEFKATCLAVLERVRRTGRPLLITRRGVPVARVLPPEPEAPGDDWLGSQRGSATLLDDLIEPVAPVDLWEATRP